MALSAYSPSTKVFRRFNAAVLLVLSFVIMLALVFATTRYFSQLEQAELAAKKQLQQQTQQLDNVLEQMLRTVTGLQEFASDKVNLPTPLAMPKLAQDEEQYYLDVATRDIVNHRRRISVNITGEGDITHFSTELKQELSMAYALTPAFVQAQHVNPSATWFYYVSLNKFVSLYPWISRFSWHYSEQMSTHSYIHDIEKAFKLNKAYWSKAFLDAAGKGMMSSLAVGVARQQQFIGALVVDINLEKLSQHLSTLAPHQRLILLDENNHVLFVKGDPTSHIDEDTQLPDVLPQSLQNIVAQNFDALNQGIIQGEWLVSKQQLSVNNWHLVQYQPYNNLTAPLLNQFLLVFVILLCAFMAFIVFVYLLTRNTFIKPTTQFIQHIEYCAQGDPGKVKPSPDWLHWFQVVENIFSQNRSLLQQLRDQNKLLDQRVNEKTQELQQKSEQHLRDYALLRSVMNAIPELLVFCDPKGRLVGCNLAVESYVGQTEQIMLASSASELIGGRLGEALAHLSVKAYQDKAGSAFQQVVWQKTKTYELFSRKFFNDLGEPLGTINLFRDVTEQYQTQSDLKQAKEQAEKANKAKSQFLANMSHEIRTPINAIQGMMMLLSKTFLSPVQKQYLDNAEVASKSLLYLIDELLDLARIESGKISIEHNMISLDDLVHKALKLNIGQAHKKQLSLRVDIDCDVPDRVLSDEIRLIQVITNLLNNAVKFTEHGYISLTITNAGTRDNLALVKFVVKDTGIGIAKENQAKLFNAFTQADDSMTRKYGGSGLGLSICKQIVNLLGGDLRLKSEVGQGSEFSFVLPFKVEQTQKTPTINFNLISLGFKLPPSLQQLLVRNKVEYHAIEHIEQLAKVAHLSQSILLASSEHLLTNDTVNQKDWLTYAKQCKAIGLVQVMMTEINADLAAQLTAQHLSWFVAEKPLFRLLLKQLVEQKYSQTTPELIKQNDTTTNEKTVSLAKEQQVENTTKSATQELDKSQNQAGGLTGVRILLVEDNLVNQMVAKELLQSMQAEVTIADNGQKAVDILTSEPDEYDIVLMDIQMPIMDGLTAAKTLRAKPELDQLPIVAMTAHATEHDHQQSLDAGMNDHIAKPIAYEALKAVILKFVADKVISAQN